MTTNDAYNPYGIEKTTNDFYYALTLDKTNSNLSFIIKTTKTADSTNIVVPILITNNFPIQKWTNVIISLDGNNLDAYIDGKLVSSNPISKAKINSNTTENVTPKVPQPNDKIILGGDAQPGDISVTRFIRYPYSISPQTALSIYSGGSGVSNSNENGVNLGLMHNNLTMTNIKLY